MSFLKRARAPSTSPIGSRFSPFPAVAGDPVRHQKLLKKTHKEAQTKVRFPSRKVTGPRPRRNRIARNRDVCHNAFPRPHLQCRKLASIRKTAAPPGGASPMTPAQISGTLSAQSCTNEKSPPVPRPRIILTNHYNLERIGFFRKYRATPCEKGGKSPQILDLSAFICVHPCGPRLFSSTSVQLAQAVFGPNFHFLG